MKLSSRLVFVFLSIAILPLVIVGTAFYVGSRQTIVRQTMHHLVAINTLKEAELNRWIEDCKESLERLAMRPYFKDSFAAVLRAYDAGDPGIGETRRQIVEDHLAPFVATGGFLELSILRMEDGLVLLSTDAEREGRYEGGRSYFIEGKKGAYIQEVTYSPSLEQPVMYVAVPVKDRQGTTLAVMAGRFDLGELTKIMEQGKNVNQTEDTYLVNNASFFVTEPRFGKNFALKETILSDGVNAALGGKSVVGLYHDYRGIPVLGAYKWLSNRDMCLVTEMEQSEVFTPVARMGWMVIGVALAVACGASVAAFLFARTITRPLQRLVRGAEEIGRGKLDHRIGTSAGDEIGELSRAFDRMSAELENTTVSRDELAREKNFSDSVINSLPGLFILFDEAGRFIRWNTNFERVTECSAEDSSRVTLGDCFAPEQREAAPSIIQQALTEGEVAAEVDFMTRSGKSIPFYLTGVRMETGDKHLVTGVGIDLTERRRVEEELRKLNEDLLRSNKDLEEFAYVASHDLQEPLRMVASYTQLLAERYGDRLDEKAEKYIRYAVDGAIRMQWLINDLLAYSRVGTRGRPFEHAEARALLDEAIRNLSMAIDESHAVIFAEDLPVVKVDPAQFIQLFQNLLSNAVKFRGEALPQVRVRARDAGTEWVFSVEDNGIGMEPRYSDRVFLIFQRLHTRDEYPGTGIGLALCKRIVERHGGRIWFESEPGKGSIFFFSLPK